MAAVPFQYFPKGFVDDYTSSVPYHVQRKRRDPLQRMVLPTLSPLVTLASPPRLEIEDHAQIPPGMVSAGSSLTPSPISPATPGSASSRYPATYQYSEVSPINGSGPSPHTLSPPVELFRSNSHAHHNMEACMATRDFETAPTASSVEAPPAPQGGFFGDQMHSALDSGSHAYDFLPYQYGMQGPSRPTPSTAAPELQWDETYSTISTGRTGNNSKWYQKLRPFYAHRSEPTRQFSNLYETSDLLDEADYSTNSSQQQVDADIQIHVNDPTGAYDAPAISPGRDRSTNTSQTQDTQQQVNAKGLISEYRPTFTKQVVRYPKECCPHCDKEFTGKYVTHPSHHDIYYHSNNYSQIRQRQLRAPRPPKTRHDNRHNR